MLTVLGFAAELLYFFVYIPSVGWGAPGTDAYAAYERANRLAALPLLVLVAGTLAIALDHRRRTAASVPLAGAVLMLVGSVSEFWIFSTESYESVPRLLAWLTFLLGALTFLIGAVVVAIAARWFTSTPVR